MNPPSDTATEALTDDPMQNQLRVYDDETMRSITHHAEDRGYLKAQAECGQQIAALRAQVRAIELTVDGLNTRAFKQKPETQGALDRIKAHCRAALEQKP